MTLVIVVTKSGKGHSGYATTREYLADIVTGLNRFYKDVLQNDEELNSFIPLTLQNAPPKRDLVLYDDAKLTTDKWTYNLIGMFVTVSGVEKGVDQLQCTVGVPTNGAKTTRRFAKTIVVDNAYKNHPKLSSYRTSCSACMWNCNMTRCILSRKAKEEEEEKEKKKQDKEQKKLEKEKKQVMKEKEKKQEIKEKEKKQETKEKGKKQATKQKEKKQETKEKEKKRKTTEEDKNQVTKEKKQKKEN